MCFGHQGSDVATEPTPRWPGQSQVSAPGSRAERAPSIGQHPGRAVGPEGQGLLSGGSRTLLEADSRGEPAEGQSVTGSRTLTTARLTGSHLRVPENEPAAETFLRGARRGGSSGTPMCLPTVTPNSQPASSPECCSQAACYTRGTGRCHWPSAGDGLAFSTQHPGVTEPACP